MSNELIEDLTNQIINVGYAEFPDGVYLTTQGNIIEEQKEWSDVDEAKDVDFTTCNYWVTAPEIEPQGYDTIEEYIEYLKERRIIK